MKMNKKQYNNIINHSLQYDCKDSENPLDTARIIFNNMGVALPQGTIKEVYDTVSTGEYMGWKKCTLEEAKEAANNGIAAMGISENKIVVLSAEDDEQPAQQTASVLTLTDNTPAVAVANMTYYIYSHYTTTYNPLYFANSSLNVTVGWNGYNTLFGAGVSTVYWVTSNSSVMTVDYYSGYLQAVGVGSAWITATTSNGYRAEFYVEIEKFSKYVTVEKIIVKDLLFGENGISLQTYPVLLRLFYNITRIDNGRVFIESVSAFTKYDRNFIIFGVQKPDIEIANIMLGGTTLNLVDNHVLATQDWVYDAKICNLNQWVSLGTEVSTKATLMCNNTTYPYAEVNAETYINM